ncbi:hypothetical protein Mlute_02512 [Meiothermus luteus]|uniref:Uncharacterized protein n=1 Tax=Meiothermus luteus TaxID=2026184 RepID=A0A399ECK2_9DEIN|nr:hypothetical protein [Meiothermus luteus]RIH82374.1 hypothetical protein Mlute_02512 [Meiothermus luteus]RMH57610.1 MAG: hypothetical protein D6684_03090 [Deinococcota bacterium]
MTPPRPHQANRALVLLLSLALLVVSLELGLRGVLMYSVVGPDELSRFNLANLCALDHQGQPREGNHSVEHGPLCFVHLLPADGLAPAQGRFAQSRFVRFLLIESALVRDAFVQNLAARGPPAA